MESEVFVCANGVTMQHIGMGVEYGYNGRTLAIVGEWEYGELNMDGSDAAFGYYERNEDGVAVVTLCDGRTFEVESEDEYEALALRLLTE